MGNLTAKTSGEIASFMSPSMTNIKSLKVHFSPKQLGAGDPSPENVREIEGWGGVEVNGSGKNLFDKTKDYYVAWLQGGGQIVKSSTDIVIYFECFPNKTYTFSKCESSVFAAACFEKKPTIGNTGTHYVRINTSTDKYTKMVYTTDSTAKYVAVWICDESKTKDKEIGKQAILDSFQIELGSTTTSYEPYQGNNISYQWKLPDEYQEVEYIESTGTQAILTDIPCQLPLKTDIDIMFTSNNDSYFCGTRYGNIRICSGGNYQTNVQWAFGTYRLTNGINLNTRYLLSTYLDNGNQLIIKDNIVLNTYQYTISDNDIKNIEGNLALFAMWLNDSQTFGQFAKAKCYGIRISNNNKMLGNFVPCYRKSDNEIGMYDTISQTFYTNQGTGTFLKGNDVDKTFYGGYVDLISGELVQEWERYIVTGDENWTYSKDLDGGKHYVSPYGVIKSLGSQSKDQLCTHFKFTGKNELGSFSIGYSGRIYITAQTDIGDTEENFKLYLQQQYNNGTPIILYWKYNPSAYITHQLTPTQLQSFVGQNNFWSNADYVEIEYDLIETEDIQKCRKKIMLNQPHTESVIGDVANFTTSMKAPLKECKVYFNPIQEGSGDPSPDNVRNIVGWDGVNVGLPDEYQEVEYIESTGTQYIDSGVNGKSGLKMIGTISYSTIINDCCFIGSRVNNTRIYLLHCFPSRFCIGYGNYYSTGVNVDKDNKYKIESVVDVGNQYLKVNDEVIFNKALNDNFDTNIPMYIFALNYNGRIDYKTEGRIYDLKLYDNNNLIRNFIPCYRKSDGEIGMYDTVFKTFYTNVGTGTFLKGDDVNTIIGNVSWSDDVGTVYGGYVDLIKGELVGNWIKRDLSEMSTINAPNSSLEEPWNHRFLIENWDYDNSGWDKIGGTDNFIIDNITNDGNGKTNFTAVGIGNSPIIYIYDNTISTIEEFKTKYSGHYICYETKFPIHYSLTPQQLLTFKGENNIWSDTNGQTEVKFWTH